MASFSRGSAAGWDQAIPALIYALLAAKILGKSTPNRRGHFFRVRAKSAAPIDTYLMQGNRMLILGKTSDQLLEGGLVPAALFAFAANARFEGSVSLQNIEC